MTYIKAVRNKLYPSLESDTPDSSLVHVYHFLDDDCTNSRITNDWNDWIFDLKSTYRFGNYAAIFKKDNNIVIGCTFDWDDDPELFYAGAATVSSKSLSHILTEWTKILTEKPDEVTIYLNDKELSIEWAFAH